MTLISTFASKYPNEESVDHRKSSSDAPIISLYGKSRDMVTYSLRDGFQQNIHGVFVLGISLLRIDYEPLQPLEKSRVVQVFEISLDPVVNEH